MTSASMKPFSPSNEQTGTGAALSRWGQPTLSADDACIACRHDASGTCSAVHRSPVGGEWDDAA